MGFIFNDDYRIHINLSNYAWKVIHEDLFNFDRENMNNLSGFINTIILNFYQEAKASIQIRCDEISSNYEQLLSENSLSIKVDPSVLYSVVDFATKNFKESAMATINSYPKDGYKKIKLRNKVAEILEDSEESDFYYGNAGNYIKALLEEYSRLPFIQREAILCKDNIELINRAIAKNKQLRIIVRSGKEFECIPYQIKSDKLGIFNYLIGIDMNSKEPVTYRIAKVKLKIISKSGHITKDMSKLIEDKLLDTDVSFLTNPNTRVVVRLNEYGVKKYNSQLHMRPPYVEKLDGGRYVFNCSIDQIKFYFIKFGSSAVIEEPLSLAYNFRNFYRYALHEYDDLKDEPED